ETVVEVGGVVGDLVHEINELGFERRALVEQEFGESGKFSGGIVAGMFDDAFADFESKIQAVEIQITLLELFDDIERVKIVVEAFAECAHAQVELFFSGVAEGWMADIVRERQRFREIAI